MKVDGNMLVDAVRSGRVVEARAAIDRGADLTYCRAYSVTDMRAFPGWQESPGLDDDSAVYLHHDLSVIRGIWSGEDVVFDRTSAERDSFCRERLNFAVPDDLDLVHRTG